MILLKKLLHTLINNTYDTLIITISSTKIMYMCIYLCMFINLMHVYVCMYYGICVYMYKHPITNHLNYSNFKLICMYIFSNIKTQFYFINDIFFRKHKIITILGSGQINVEVSHFTLAHIKNWRKTSNIHQAK